MLAKLSTVRLWVRTFRFETTPHYNGSSRPELWRFCPTWFIHCVRVFKAKRHLRSQLNIDSTSGFISGEWSQNLQQKWRWLQSVKSESSCSTDSPCCFKLLTSALKKRSRRYLEAELNQTSREWRIRIVKDTNVRRKKSLWQVMALFGWYDSVWVGLVVFLTQNRVQNVDQEFPTASALDIIWATINSFPFLFFLLLSVIYGLESHHEH